MNHYFEENPVTEHKEKYLDIRFQGIDFQFKTDSSVFSRRDLDYGSQFLIETIISDRLLHGRYLDLGCGYGPIGIIIKRLYPHLNLTMADINQRAIKLARQNLKLNHIKYVDVIASDGMKNIGGQFDIISLNPPIRTGKEVIYRLFNEAYQQLDDQGSLYIVIQKKQGAASAINALATLTPHVSRIDRSAGYWIIRADRKINDK